MKLSQLTQLLQAISEADEKNNPASIFNLVSESIVWSHAATIFDDPEQNCLFGPTLLKGIGAVLPRLEDKAAVRKTLLHALHSIFDSLTYEAAQRVILSYSQEWERSTARQFYNAFADVYQRMMETGDQFIAMLALEGAVMLPLYRADDSLLYNAIGLLLNDFPSIPTNPDASAYLPVKALKLLSRCYDRHPQDSVIVQKVQEIIGCANYSVDTEAHFTLGVIYLYDSFRAADSNSFLAALTKANDLFKTAARSEEQRTDAELFTTITQCYISLLTTVQVQDIALTVREAKEILTERLLAFGGASPSTINVEFQFIQLMSYLDRWIETLSEATRWPDIKPPLQILADTYAAVRQLETTSELINDASKMTQELIMLPYIHGRFVQIQEATAKLASILSDQIWRAQASPSEIEFYEILSQAIQSVSSPKDLAATELEKVRVAASNDTPNLARLITSLEESGKSAHEVLISFAWQLFEKERSAMRAVSITEGPVKDIFDNIASDLSVKLGWDLHSVKWESLAQAIRLVARYLVRMYRTTQSEATPTDVKFLFAEDIGGLGKKALEEHLEGHFYNAMSFSDWGGIIDRQPGSAAPGRPDLLFRFPNDIVFPIEVKRESNDSSHSSIHEQYVTQAQSYAAGTLGVSFLFVLDLTPKQLGMPLPNVVDCCYLDHRPVPNSSLSDYVIVLIFPANRVRPSDHSWGRQKKSSERTPQKRSKTS